MLTTYSSIIAISMFSCTYNWRKLSYFGAGHSMLACNGRQWHNLQGLQASYSQLASPTE